LVEIAAGVLIKYPDTDTDEHKKVGERINEKLQKCLFHTPPTKEKLESRKTNHFLADASQKTVK